MNALSRSSYGIIFDIDSATVGVAIAKYQKGGPISILYSSRTVIKFGDGSSAADLGIYVSTAIETAGKKAIDKLGSLNINNKYSVHAIIHAPWGDSKSEREEGVLEKEEKVTKELLQHFMERHLPDKKLNGRVQFDKHIVQIEVNGYVTAHPYKKMAKSIAMTVLKSSMDESIHQDITSAFSNVFPNHSVHLDSFLFAATQLKELFRFQDAYTIVDIGGEYTSLSIVRNDTISKTTWTNFGTEKLIQALTKEDSTRKSTIAELVMYINNTCTPAQCRKIDTLLESPEKEWVRAFGDGASKLGKTHKMPTQTFVSVDKRFAPWFEKVIERLDFAQFTVTGNPLEAQTLSVEHSHRKVKYMNSVRKDSILSLGALFVDK